MRSSSGAGLSGLAAARELERAGLDVRVLEARDRVGGRTLNHSVGERPEDVVELGGQWVGPTQLEAMALAGELGLETYPTYNEGKSVFENPAGRLSRYTGTIPRMNPLVLADYGRADARFKRMYKRVDPRRALGGGERRGARQRDLRDLDQALGQDPDGPRGAGAGDPGRVFGRAGRPQRPARPLLRGQRGRLGRAAGGGRGRPAGPGRRRIAADLAGDGRRAGRAGAARDPGPLDPRRRRLR